MNEPIYRWECTLCDASGVVQSSEMARLMVNRHVAEAHPDHLDHPAARSSTEAASKRAR